MAGIETTVANLFSGIGGQQRDKIAIFNQDYSRVFKNADIMDVRVKEDARTMEHPVEDGTIITDHRIILPVEIEIVVSLLSADYPSVYNQIRQNFYDSELFTIQTRTGTYENQMITSLPHAESSEVMNGIVMTLNFRQVLIVTAVTVYAAKNASDSDTVNRGTQQGTPANDSQTGKATSGLFNVSGKAA